MNGGKLSRETEMVKLTSSFKLEYELIDRDHRRLIEIINDVKQVIEDGKPEECETLVPDFVNLAKKHFQSEEAFLKKIGYPNQHGHHDHHHGLNEKMETMLSLAKKVSKNKLARKASERKWCIS